VRPQDKNLTPWPKGTSGNPTGLAGNSKRFIERFAELQAELEASGVPLTARERVDLEMAVTLSLRRTKSVHDHAQAASTTKRLLDPLYARRIGGKPQLKADSLREYAREKYGASP
jgi:hypothetical protein